VKRCITFPRSVILPVKKSRGCYAPRGNCYTPEFGCSICTILREFFGINAMRTMLHYFESLIS
jgi:hypothetical protein